MTEKQPTPQQAEKAVEQARTELERAVDVQAQIARGGVPHLIVEVLPGATAKDEHGVHHEEGGQFAVEGLTAVGLAGAGTVTIIGTADDEEIDDEARRKAALQADIDHLEDRLAGARRAAKGSAK